MRRRQSRVARGLGRPRHRAPGAGLRPGAGSAPAHARRLCRAVRRRASGAARRRGDPRVPQVCPRPRPHRGFATGCTDSRDLARARELPALVSSAGRARLLRDADGLSQGAGAGTAETRRASGFHARRGLPRIICCTWTTCATSSSCAAITRCFLRSRCWCSSTRTSGVTTRPPCARYCVSWGWTTRAPIDTVQTHPSRELRLHQLHKLAKLRRIALRNVTVAGALSRTVSALTPTPLRGGLRSRWRRVAYGAAAAARRGAHARATAPVEARGRGVERLPGPRPRYGMGL